MYSCRYEGLQLYKKVAPLKIISCEICEALQNIIFKEDCSVTASDLLSFVLAAINKLIQNKLSKTSDIVTKQFIVFYLKIIKDNKSMTKIAGSILLVRSTQQRKW